MDLDGLGTNLPNNLGQAQKSTEPAPVANKTLPSMPQTDSSTAEPAHYTDNTLTDNMVRDKMQLSNQAQEAYKKQVAENKSKPAVKQDAVQTQAEVTTKEEIKKEKKNKKPQTENKAKIKDSYNDIEKTKKEIEQLRQREAEVRRKKLSKKIAAGNTADHVVYEYSIGPDGKRYAVSGHVVFDTSEEDTPQETLKKARTLMQAAVISPNSSQSDIHIARKADELAKKAQKELIKENIEKLSE